MLKIEGLSKNYKDFRLDDINLEVKPGEYFMLLGKSGSGKSLLLQILSGLVAPDSGKIFLQGSDITQRDIQKRNIGLLFQDYAIFPHLDVFENIAYPLRIKKLKKDEIKKRVEQLTVDLEIPHLIKRGVCNLSGGEKQRVALARTLALEPKILLLDEPLSSLDVQLKREIRHLLRKINQKGQTIIHVTHDHEEALLLAQKVAVINLGQIVQTGTTKEVFHYPASEFVANFTGIKNFFNATIENHSSSGTYSLRINEKTLLEATQKPKSKLVACIVPCQDIIISKQKMDSTAANNFEGEIVEILPWIGGCEVIVDFGIRLASQISSGSRKRLGLKEGQKVWVSFKAAAVKLLE
jgi:molybdate/tungstate transport system ATP-binding protein